jgi:hypothetical protein
MLFNEALHLEAILVGQIVVEKDTVWAEGLGQLDSWRRGSGFGELELRIGHLQPPGF